MLIQHLFDENILFFENISNFFKLSINYLSSIYRDHSKEERERKSEVRGRKAHHFLMINHLISLDYYLK